MANAVMLELLGGWALLMDVVALILPEGVVHLRARDVDGVEARRPLVVGRDRFPDRPLGWRDALGVAITLAMVAGFVALLARWP